MFSLTPLTAVAHPHIFIDTGFELITDDQGRLSHIRVTWVYDDFYSLLITEDLGIDSDGDGILSDQDQSRLTGFDANWMNGFNGDLVTMLNGEELGLSGPLEPTAALENGGIYTTHLRSVANTPDLAGQQLSLKPFDSTYYTAYEITMPVTVSGAAMCQIELLEPDFSGTDSKLRDELADLGPDDVPDAAQQSQISSVLSPEVRISCSGS